MEILTQWNGVLFLNAEFFALTVFYLQTSFFFFVCRTTLLDIKFARRNPFSEWVEINKVSTDFRITILNQTIDHTIAIRNPYFFDFPSLRYVSIHIYELNFPGFFTKFFVFCSATLKTIGAFYNDLGVYRNGTRQWFNEFVFIFWSDCYRLLRRSLLPKLRFVFVHDFECLPLENGTVLYDELFSQLKN